MARVITLTSASAGVGKTVIGVHLAAQLARRGKRVCLLDTGGGAANASVSLGLEPGHSCKDLRDPRVRLDEVLIRDRSGFDVLAGGSGEQWLAALAPPQLDALLAALSRLDDYDVVLIDASTTSAAHTPTWVRFSTELILVITPAPVPPPDVYSLLSALVSESAEKRIRVVVNKSDNLMLGKHSYSNFREVGSFYLGMQLALLGVVGETPPEQQLLPPRQRTIPGPFERSMGALTDHLLLETAALPEQTMQSVCARYRAAEETRAAGEQAVVPVLELPLGRKQKLRREIEYLSRQVDDLIKEIEQLRRAPHHARRTPHNPFPETFLTALASESQSVTLQGETFSICSMPRSDGSRQHFAWHSLEDGLETSEPTPGASRGEYPQ